MELELFPVGDTVVQIVFGKEISEESNRNIRTFVDRLEKHPIEGVVEWVPAYTTLSIFYRPDIILYKEICKKLESIQIDLQGTETVIPSLIYEIPTFYGGEVGSDLSYVAQYNDLTEEEVIATHTSKEYLIYMMGFLPGFPYLGGMPKRIATPRRKNPRPMIKKGSVGIAGEQTGIYPIESPGGWQIIGQTPVRLYDLKRDKPILLSSGDYLKFVSICKEEYGEIENAIQRGEYTVKCTEKRGRSVDV